MDAIARPELRGAFAGAKRRAACALGLSAWIAAIGLGMHLEFSYAATPGPGLATASELGEAAGDGEPLPAWPAQSQLSRANDRPTLILFAHPQCPCTRASLAELGELLERAPAFDAQVVFVRPAGTSEEWLHGASWADAAKLPGVRVLADANGAEAARFGASTSGTVAIYSASGALLFSGGITAMRGHRGDNGGEEQALAALRGQVPEARTHPVFGCALEGSSQLEASR